MLVPPRAGENDLRARGVEPHEADVLAPPRDALRDVWLLPPRLLPGGWGGGRRPRRLVRLARKDGGLAQVRCKLKEAGGAANERVRLRHVDQVSRGGYVHSPP